MHRLLTLILTAAFVLLVPAQALAAKGDLQGALAFVPRDSFAVVTADLEDVKKSALFNMAKQTLLAEEKSAKRDLAELKKKTGFDVWRDIHAAVIAFDKDFPKDDDRFALIAHATYDERKLMAFAKGKGGKMQLKQGPSGPYYLLGKRKDGALAFRGKYIILAGAKIMPTVLKKQGMGAKVRGLLAPYKSRDIAMAMEVIPTIAKQLAREDKMLKDAKTVAAGLDLTSGADLKADAGFATATTPQKLANIANQGLAEIAKDESAKKMGVDGFLRKISVRAVGRKLEGRVKLSNGDLKRLEKLLRGLLF